MGAPGYTCFCKNGHIAKQVEHGHIDMTTIHVCPFCKETQFVSLIEWPDKDYGNNELVPSDPIKKESMRLDNKLFKGKIKINIYDMSKIKEEDWHEGTM